VLCGHAQVGGIDHVDGDNVEQAKGGQQAVASLSIGEFNAKIIDDEDERDTIGGMTK
jgi:hypothetical protein